MQRYPFILLAILVGGCTVYPYPPPPPLRVYYPPPPPPQVYIPPYYSVPQVVTVYPTPPPSDYYFYDDMGNRVYVRPRGRQWIYAEPIVRFVPYVFYGRIQYSPHEPQS